MRKDEFPIVDKYVEQEIKAVLEDIKAEIPTLSRWQSSDGQDLVMIADVMECIDKHISRKE